MMDTAAKEIKGHRHGRVPREVREAQLLDVAEGIFATYGYQGASIDSIADAAGVTRPMVYNYFSSKDGIYLACLRRARGRLEQQLTQAVENITDTRERMERAANAYFLFVEENERSWEVLFGGGTAVAGPAAREVLSLRFRTIKLLATILQNDLYAELKDFEMEAFANLMSGAGEQLAKWWRYENRSLPRAQIVQYHVSLCWDGFDKMRKNKQNEK